MPPAPEPLAGTRFGLIADAHVHPGGGPPLPDLSTLFAGVDGILALGDLGEAAGLDALERIAPVTGVLGEDDAAGDRRLPAAVRLFELGGLSVGALFSGATHGLFAANDPLAVSPDFDAAMQRLFGRKLDVLLCAATHKACIASASGVLIINPGSPSLSDQPTVAVLHIASQLARVESFRL